MRMKIAFEILGDLGALGVGFQTLTAKALRARSFPIFGTVSATEVLQVLLS
jgi:hypothetical protein